MHFWITCSRTSVRGFVTSSSDCEYATSHDFLSLWMGWVVWGWLLGCVLSSLDIMQFGTGSS